MGVEFSIRPLFATVREAVGKLQPYFVVLRQNFAVHLGQARAARTTSNQRVSKDWTWPEELLLGKSGFIVSLCWSRSIYWLP